MDSQVGAEARHANLQAARQHVSSLSMVDTKSGLKRKRQRSEEGQKGEIPPQQLFVLVPITKHVSFMLPSGLWSIQSRGLSISVSTGNS